jgi:hypothetical protein
MKTMLQIIQAATVQLGIPTPQLVAGVNNTDSLQLLALLNQLADDLQRDFIWQALCTEYRFTTQSLTATGTLTANTPIITGLSASTALDSTYQVLGTGVNNDTYVNTLDSPTQVTMSQAATTSGTVTLTFCKTKYAFPAGYDRIQDRTQWDKSKHWEMLGPETPQMWQWLKSGYISTGPRIRWRIMGGYFQIWPATSSPEYLGFEYISNAFALSAAGVPKTSFTADTDTCIFPDGLMITGLKMMYQQAKGLGSEFVDKFQELLGIAKANDGGSADLHMAPNPLNTLIGWENIPDSGYGA